MKLVKMLDRIYAEFDSTGEVAAPGKSPSPEVEKLRSRWSQLRSRVRDLDRARTHIDFASVWSSDVRPFLSHVQAAFAAVRSAAATTGLRAGAKRASVDLDAFAATIEERENDRSLHETTSLTLMRFTLLPFGEERRRTRIFDYPGLAGFELTIDLVTTTASRQWLQEPDKARSESLQAWILDELDALRSKLWTQVWAGEQDMAHQGVTDRKSRLAATRRALMESRQDVRRACRRAIARWYMRSVRLREIRDRYPVTASTRWHRGAVALTPEVADASESFAHELRMYTALVDGIYEDTVKRLARDRRRLTVAVEALVESVEEASVVISDEANDRSRMGRLRDLVGQFSSALEASFSGLDEALTALLRNATVMDTLLQRNARRLGGLPGQVYQCELRRRRMVDLVRLGEFGKPVTSAVARVSDAQKSAARNSAALSGGYSALRDIVDDLTAWARASQGKSASDLDVWRFGKLSDALFDLEAESWLKQHALIGSATARWSADTEKLAQSMQ